MLSESAVVTVAGKTGVRIKTDRAATCAGCGLKRGCGQYLLGAQRRSNISLDQFWVQSGNEALRPGQRVQVAMSEQGLLFLIAIFYLLPLAGLLVAATVAWCLDLREGGQVLLVSLGLIAGILGSRYVLRRTRHTRHIAVHIIPDGEQSFPALSSGDSLS